MGCVNANQVSLDLCASTANVLMAALAMANAPHCELPSEHRAHSTHAVSVTRDSVVRTAPGALQTGSATTMEFWRLVLVFAKLLGTGNAVKLKAVRKTVVQLVARAFARRQLENAKFGCHLERQGTSPRAVLRCVFAMMVSKEVSSVNSGSSSTRSRLQTVLSVKSEMSTARRDVQGSAKLSAMTSTRLLVPRHIFPVTTTATRSVSRNVARNRGLLCGLQILQPNICRLPIRILGTMLTQMAAPWHHLQN